MFSKLLLIVLLVVILVGCESNITTEYGPELRESAVVLETLYVPANHGFGVGVGISTSGNLSAVPTTISIPASYSVVFGCQHGKFAVRSKETWDKVKQGQEVTVVYRQVIRADKKQNLRSVVDLDFLRVE